MSDRPEKLYLSAPNDDHEHQVWFDPNEGGTEYVRADLYAALEAQLAEVKEALTAIDGLAVMEINPSNYDHDDVCELNRNASHASVIARDALSTLEATPPAPKVTQERSFIYDSEAAPNMRPKTKTCEQCHGHGANKHGVCEKCHGNGFIRLTTE